MWHGAYLSWLEEARINSLLNVGLAYKDLSNEGFEMPVIQLNIEYRKPLLHGDKVVLQSWVYPGKGVKWHWETKFIKHSNQICALANVDLVLIKKEKAVNRLIRKGPAHICKALVDLQRGPC